MFKLIAATLAALYCVLLVFGDDARRPAEVARAEPTGLSFINVEALPEVRSGAATHVSDISDRDAVKLAIAAGEAYRNERRNVPQVTRMTRAEEAESAVREAAPTAANYWFVTGSVVNLRGGPGTSNPVVGQVTWGTEAEVLADQDGWYRIRLADGSSSGWIFGKFLADQRPG